MRAEHTPNGSAGERQRQAARRAALGLTPGSSGQQASGKNTSTKPGTSQVTSGQTSSSLGQESENEGMIGATRCGGQLCAIVGGHGGTYVWQREAWHDLVGMC